MCSMACVYPGWRRPLEARSHRSRRITARAPSVFRFHAPNMTNLSASLTKDQLHVQLRHVPPWLSMNRLLLIVVHQTGPRRLLCSAGAEPAIIMAHVRWLCRFEHWSCRSLGSIPGLDFLISLVSEPGGALRQAVPHGRRAVACVTAPPIPARAPHPGAPTDKSRGATAAPRPPRRRARSFAPPADWPRADLVS